MYKKRGDRNSKRVDWTDHELTNWLNSQGAWTYEHEGEATFYRVAGELVGHSVFDSADGTRVTWIYVHKEYNTRPGKKWKITCK